jgi:hypothetical protein
MRLHPPPLLLLLLLPRALSPAPAWLRHGASASVPIAALVLVAMVA